MKLSEIRFAAVEDRDDAVNALLAILKDTGLSLGRAIGNWPTLEAARNGLENKWEEVDVIFLDLNIPLDTNDSSPSKDHGLSLLNFITNDFNKRGQHKISVIIVSGEVHTSYEQKLLVNYSSVVLGLAPKGQLTTTLPEILKHYCEDPYTALLRSYWPAAEPIFQAIIDETKDADSRSLACQNLGRRLLANIAQYEQNLPDQSAIAGRELKPLLSDYLARNFKPDPQNGRVQSAITLLKRPADTWVLRGYLTEYLWTINNFRNVVIHRGSIPFHNGVGGYGIWAGFQAEVNRLETGQRMCQILVLMVQDLLDWYLPWHRKVYAPWLRTQSAPASATK